MRAMAHSAQTFIFPYFVSLLNAARSQPRFAANHCLARPSDLLPLARNRGGVTIFRRHIRLQAIFRPLWCDSDIRECGAPIRNIEDIGMETSPLSAPCAPQGRGRASVGDTTGRCSKTNPRAQNVRVCNNSANASLRRAELLSSEALSEGSPTLLATGYGEGDR